MVQLHIPTQLKRDIYAWLKTNNIANRGKDDGNIDKQMYGLVAEHLVYQLFFGKEKDLITGFDGGYDFLLHGKRVDVKTMVRNSFVRPYYVNNFYKLQEHFDCDVLIFTSIHKEKSVLEICGWMDKNKFLSEAIFEPKGTPQKRSDGSFFVLRSDNYIIKNNQLNKIQELWN